MATITIMHTAQTDGLRFLVAVDGNKRGNFATLTAAEDFVAGMLPEVVAPTVDPRSISVVQPKKKGR